MYYVLQRDYYWPHIADDVLSVAWDCHSCAKTINTVRKHHRPLELLPAAESLAFVAPDLLGPVSKTERGHQLLLVVIDRFFRLVRFVPLRTSKASIAARPFLDHWVYAYEAPAYVLTDSGPQLVAKFFDAVCAMLGV